MATIEKFTRAMLAKFVTDREWRNLVDKDGDYLVEFSYDEDYGCELTLYLIASGEQNEILEIRISSSMRIPKERWGEAINACNIWNDMKRWPKVYLHVSNPDTDTVGRIVCEGHIDLEQGIHQELLDSVISSYHRNANSFWRWLHSEYGYTMAFAIQKPAPEPQPAPEPDVIPAPDAPTG